MLVQIRDDVSTNVSPDFNGDIRPQRKPGQLSSIVFIVIIQVREKSDDIATLHNNQRLVASRRGKLVHFIPSPQAQEKRIISIPIPQRIDCERNRIRSGTGIDERKRIKRGRTRSAVLQVERVNTFAILGIRIVFRHSRRSD